ncbi:MAG: hypothetical protein HEQ12_07540 [Aphanizomenon flos-aquae DEX188]|jgi:predicted nucleic acid-binding protein|nr:hypothetical protein [Nostocales cyanobacterium W4_Combined_metabat2_030]QSV66821.1 MAG: hypothetical protein HEQ12_07540 [Aphanizomenon flos-aquae DEX188]
MIIVSNTSDQLSLLEDIYVRIIIPEAVYNELTDIRAGEKVNNALKNANWIEIRSVINKQSVRKLELNLDQGEAEAIILAVELNANQLLQQFEIKRGTKMVNFKDGKKRK